jgi:hypothetical protein
MQAQIVDNSTQAILDAEEFYANLTSTININGTAIDLPAPPLSLGNLGMLLNPFNASSMLSFTKCFNNQELAQNFTPPMYCVTNSELYSSKSYFHTNMLVFLMGAESQGAVSGARMIRLSLCLKSQNSSEALSSFTLSWKSQY